MARKRSRRSRVESPDRAGSAPESAGPEPGAAERWEEVVGPPDETEDGAPDAGSTPEPAQAGREPTLWDGFDAARGVDGSAAAEGAAAVLDAPDPKAPETAAVEPRDEAGALEAREEAHLTGERGEAMVTSTRVAEDGGLKEPPAGSGEPDTVASEDERLDAAKARARVGDYDGATAICRDLLLDDPGNVRVRVLLGQIFEQRGDNLQALDQYEAARTADPDNVNVLSRLGMVLATLGRFEQAERELRRAQRLDPNRPDVHATVGILHFKRGLYGPAELELRRTIELDPDHAAAHFYRGESLNQLGRVDEALEMLSRAVQLQPNNARAYYTMGILYDKKRLPQQAEAMFRKAREIGRG